MDDIVGSSSKSAVRLSSSSPSLKHRSRRSVEKRVMSVPIAEAEGSRAKGASETAPPSDSWAWRKYGQKPIKGSPYPRGYYRCSSSKGCPARKQVERSRVDPTMLLVTYSCEHNHSWPLPKNNNSNNSRYAPAAIKDGPDPDPNPNPGIRQNSPPESDPEVEDKFSGFIGDESALMAMPMPDDFWFSDVGSTASTSPPTDAMLFGPIFSAELALDDCAKSGAGAVNAEDDGLFDGLGELPEYSVVFRRSYLERQMAAG